MTSPPPSRQVVLDAAIALQISTAIGTVVTGTILFLSMVSLYEHRNEVTVSRAMNRWRIPLLMTVTFGFIIFCLDGATVWRSWGPGEGCELFGIFITLCYVMEKQFLNLFLYDKAKVVHEALAMTERKKTLLRLMRWLLWLTLTIGVPISFYWAAFLALASRPLPEGKCLYFAVFPVVPIIFAIADAILALGMLAIFLVPLWEHQGGMNKASVLSTGNNEAFNRMIRRNIRYSVLAILSGVCGLSLYALFNWLSDGTPATEHLPIWGLFCISWDNLVSNLAVHCMTPKWLPKRIVRYIVTSSVGPSSDRKNNTMSNNVGTTSPTRTKRRVEDGDEGGTVLSNNSAEPSSYLAPAAYLSQENL